MLFREKIKKMSQKLFSNTVCLNIKISRSDESLEQILTLEYDAAEAIEFGQTFIGICVSHKSDDGTHQIGISMTELVDGEPHIIARKAAAMVFPGKCTLSLNDDKNNISTIVTIGVE